MLALNASSLLTAWEQGVSQHPLQRAVRLLALAWPQRTSDEWARVSIGERDRQLLQLRDELFGSKFEAVATCPICSERLELMFDKRDLLTQGTQEITEWQQLECAGFDVSYRLPTSADLLEVSNNPGQARELLLERCVEARADGVAVSASALPSGAVKLLGEKMAEADPQAEVQILLDCPACAHQWTTVFDILSFVILSIKAMRIRCNA